MDKWRVGRRLLFRAKISFLHLAALLEGSALPAVCELGVPAILG